MSALVELMDEWLQNKSGEIITSKYLNLTAMKLNFSIECNPEELLEILTDKEFHNFTKNISKVATAYHKEESAGKVAMVKVAQINPAEAVKILDKQSDIKLLKPAEPVIKSKYLKKGNPEYINPLKGKTNSLKGRAAKKTDKTCGYCKGKYQGFNSQVYCSDECKAAAKLLLIRGANVNPVEAPAVVSQNTENRPNVNPAKAPAAETLSWYQRKKLEEKQAKEEQDMLDGLKDHPKIDWKEAKKEKYQHESLSI